MTNSRVQSTPVARSRNEAPLETLRFIPEVRGANDSDGCSYNVDVACSLAEYDSSSAPPGETGRRDADAVNLAPCSIVEPTLFSKTYVEHDAALALARVVCRGTTFTYVHQDGQSLTLWSSPRLSLRAAALDAHCLSATSRRCCTLASSSADGRYRRSVTFAA